MSLQEAEHLFSQISQQHARLVEISRYLVDGEVVVTIILKHKKA